MAAAADSPAPRAADAGPEGSLDPTNAPRSSDQDGAGLLDAVAAAGEEKPVGVEAGEIDAFFEAAAEVSILAELRQLYLENPPPGLSEDEFYAYGRQYLKRVFGAGATVAGAAVGAAVERAAAEAWFDKEFSRIQAIFWKWQRRRSTPSDV